MNPQILNLIMQLMQKQAAQGNMGAADSPSPAPGFVAPTPAAAPGMQGFGGMDAIGNAIGGAYGKMSTDSQPGPVPEGEGGEGDDGKPNPKKGEWKKAINDGLQKVAGPMGGIGSIMSQVGLKEDGTSNTGLSTAGGAMQGASALAAFGPLGMLGGALLGGVSGNIAANKSNADYYDGQAMQDEFALSAKTINPSLMGKGGIMKSEDFLPVQMELDEYYATPGADIYKSKATKKHEKMEKDEVTDVVAANSFAFSNRKTFVPKKYSEDVLGYGFAYYNEEGDYSLEKVEMENVFGDSKKKITFSEGIKKVRDKFKTVRGDDKDADIFTQVTNQENKQARIPYMNKLIQIHSNDYKKTEPYIPQKFGAGGPMRFALGGGVGPGSPGTNFGVGNGDDIIKWLQTQQAGAVTGLPIAEQGNFAPQTIAPTTLQGLQQGNFSPQTITPSAPTTLQLQQAVSGITSPITGNTVVPGQGMAGIAGGLGAGIGNAYAQPNIGNMLMGKTDAASAGATNSPFEGDFMSKIYSDMSGQIQKLTDQNEADRASSMGNSGGIFNKLRQRNGMAGMSSMLSTALQSTQINPNLRSGRFADEMFQETSPALADSMAYAPLAQGNSLALEMMRANPGGSSEAIGKVMDAALGQSNDVRSKIILSDQAQNRAKYSFLNDLDFSNRSEINRADEATRDVVNRKRNAMSDAFNNNLAERSAIDVNEYQFGQGVNSQYNSNAMALMGNNAALMGQQGLYNIQRSDQQLREQLMRDSMTKWQAGLKSAAPVATPTSIPVIPVAPGLQPLPGFGGRTIPEAIAPRSAVVTPSQPFVAPKINITPPKKRKK